MLRVLLPALVAILLSAVASAEDFATEMLGATFKLYDPDSTATCMLVRREAPDAGLYLATAAHVLSRTKGETAIIVLRERDAEGNFHRHDYKIPIRRDGHPLWTQHPVEDVAVLRLDEPLPVPAKALPFASLATEADFLAAGLHICSEFFVLTFPHRFEGNGAGFPVARQGIIASYPLAPVQQLRTFHGDFTTFAGDSGGPVFVAKSDGHPLVIGIVLAQSRHDETVKTEEEELTIHHSLEIGTILHAEFVRETIKQAAEAGSGEKHP